MMNTKFLLFLGFMIVVAFAASHQKEFENDSLDMEDMMIIMTTMMKSQKIYWWEIVS